MSCGVGPRGLPADAELHAASALVTLARFPNLSLGLFSLMPLSFPGVGGGAAHGIVSQRTLCGQAAALGGARRGHPPPSLVPFPGEAPSPGPRGGTRLSSRGGRPPAPPKGLSCPPPSALSEVRSGGLSVWAGSYHRTALPCFPSVLSVRVRMSLRVLQCQVLGLNSALSF